MRTLYHTHLSPQCRKIRLALAEKGLDCELIEENVWRPSDELLAINPLRTLPVLMDAPDDDTDPVTLLHSQSIAEYLDEVYPEKPLIKGAPGQRAEIRRLCAWFEERFEFEVGQNLFYEKIEKRLAGEGPPDMDVARIGLDNINYHLEYISLLIEKRNWLAGEDYSLADISAAAHLSTIDYLGDVPWVHFPMVKGWYVRIKSRRSFRSLLADRVPGMPPPRHYPDLDF